MIGLFAVGRIVEARFFILRADPQAAERLEAASDGIGRDRRPENGDPDRLELKHELRPGLEFPESTEAGGAEDRQQHGADDPAETMDREDIEAVVDLQLLLHPSAGEVAGHAGNQAEQDGAGRTDHAGRRGDSGEAGDGASRRADNARFAGLQSLHQRPSQRRGGRGEVGHQQGHAGRAVGGELAAGIEAEPADPQQPGAGHDHPWAVRRLQVAGESAALAKHGRQHQRTGPGGRVDHDAAREIDHARLEHPAGSGPGPVGDRGVDQREPEGGKDQHRAEADPLDKGPDHQARRDDGESHLEHREQRLRDRAGDAGRGHALEKGGAEVAEPGAVSFEGQAVKARRPEDRGQRGDHQAVHQHAQQVLRPDQSAVEKGERRQGHQQHQRGGC